MASRCWCPKDRAAAGLVVAHGDLWAARVCPAQPRCVFPRDVDAVITNAAGWFGDARVSDDSGAPHEAGPKRLSRGRSAMFRVFLSELDGGNRFAKPASGWPIRMPATSPMRRGSGSPAGVVAGDSRSGPAELADGPCCGSAGSHNLDQPEIAASLGRGRRRQSWPAGLRCAASGNIGCLTQMDLHLRRAGARATVRHTVQVLRDSLAAEGHR